MRYQLSRLPRFPLSPQIFKVYLHIGTESFQFIQVEVFDQTFLQNYGLVVLLFHAPGPLLVRLAHRCTSGR
jgi:hypothetical protein